MHKWKQGDNHSLTIDHISVFNGVRLIVNTENWILTGIWHLQIQSESLLMYKGSLICIFWSWNKNSKPFMNSSPHPIYPLLMRVHVSSKYQWNRIYLYISRYVAIFILIIYDYDFGAFLNERCTKTILNKQNTCRNYKLIIHS